MKAQDQDHIYDTKRRLSVVLSMNEQSHYKQEKTKTRPKKAKLKRHIFNIKEDKVKSRYPPSRTSTLGRSKKTSTLGEIVSLNSIKLNKKCNEYLSWGGISFLDLGLEKGQYGVSKVFDTAYWGFLGVGTMHRYAVSSMMDTAYWVSEQ
ncbi:hypothetical protein Tco_0780960 [Tanacetum coccineum]